MTPDTTEIIFDELPDRLKSIVAILSVPSTLTQKTAETLLQHTGYANGNAFEVVKELKSFPVWIKRNRISWAIDDELREIALKKLNGSSLKIKRDALNVLKEYQPNFDEYSYTESKDFQLQIARLGLSVPEERDHAIGSLRSFFESAELFNNHESSRVISTYIDESLDIDKIQGHYPESTLSAFFMRGLHAYRSKDNRTALKYLTTAWKRRGNSFDSIKDAAIASHLVGLIHSKDRNHFREAEEAFRESLELLKAINDRHGLAQVYHSLGNLYSKDRNRFREAERAYQESLELEEVNNNQYGLAQVYHSLGNLYSKDRNRFREAEEAYQKSLKLRIPVNDTYGLAQTYHSLGNLYSKDRSRFREAERAYQESLEIGKQINHKHHLAQVYHSVGNLYSKDRNRFREAEEAYQESVEIGLKLKNSFHLAQVYMNFGKLKISQKKYKDARNFLTESLGYEKNNYFRNIIKKLIRDLPN